jgi:hypothetical protein
VFRTAIFLQLDVDPLDELTYDGRDTVHGMLQAAQKWLPPTSTDVVLHSACNIS